MTHERINDSRKRKDSGTDATISDYPRAELLADGGDASAEYETKTVRVHLPERGQYVYFMLTRFDGRGHLLADEGWRGEYIQYTTVSRNAQMCDAVTGDAYAFIRENEWLQDTPGEAFVKDLDFGRIDWADIEDGARYAPADVARLAGREEVATK